MDSQSLQGFEPVRPRPLIERLRDVGETTPICKEAIGEIERLTAEVEKLRAMGRSIVKMIDGN